MTREDCRRFEPLLARAADDALGAGDRARLAAHLAACPSCRYALEDQRHVRNLLRERPVVTAGAGFAARVMTAIETERSWLDRADFRRWTWRLAPAAAALLTAVWLVLQQTPAPAPGEPAAETRATFNAELPVSAALWQDSLSGSSVLSLMLTASADDRLADAYRER